MIRLAMTLFSVIATTVMGSAIIAALVSGYDTMIPLIIAAAAGFVVSIPLSYFIAKAIYVEG
jgi:uncharacterized membrane protein YcaP (DUF421 family)